AEERFRVDTRFLIGVVVAIGVTLAVVGATRNGITLTGDTFRAQQIGSASDPYHTFSFDQTNLGLVNTAGNVQVLGGQLFTTFLLPFEITSLLLLVAAVGAVYMTRRRGGATAILRRTVRPSDADTIEEERIEVEVG
ncbi:MAG: NADH-quinone oxidoreductase subunit J, partial [Candidatus Dormibacteraeota bacterium]|nr:NADH-quinone oxidoreductase subunit J [Candidatus Dormibacteraeota bacterium]